MKEKNYIVYTASVDDSVIYVGSGLYGRQNHCNSGMSHVYDLNRLHFERCDMLVEVIRFGLSKADSLAIEKQTIKYLLPIYNRTHNPQNSITWDNRRVKELQEKSVALLVKDVDQCLTKDQLLTSIKLLDTSVEKPVDVNYSALLQSVTEGILTVKESSMVAFMSENVTAWNYYIGRVCDLEHIISDPKNLNRALKGLESKGLIKISHKGFFYKDSVVINISPFYAWKGDMSVRGTQVDKWYSGSSLIA